MNANTSSVAAATPYEIERQVEFKAGATTDVVFAWQPVGRLSASSAEAALRGWVSGQGAEIDDRRELTLRAIPTSRITQRTIKVHVERKVELT